VGDAALNESYPIYGEQVTAAGAGRVIPTRNDLPDNTPVGTLPQPVTLDNAAGNYVVQSLPGRRYALYAHFRPGTVRVAPGDRVQAGQVLGLVGNSGNSDEAHCTSTWPTARPCSPPTADPTSSAPSASTGTCAIWRAAHPPSCPPAPPRKRTAQLPVHGDIVAFP
jgi:hypothetical protein